jgi:glycosyltransferase involved in cell wall biosynthesis
MIRRSRVSYARAPRLAVKLSVITPCYNEEANVLPLYEAVRAEIAKLPEVEDYEHIYIDNASTDATVALVKTLCAKDRRVKLIVNNRNFGHIRSPYHALLQASGDAVVAMASDFQDPPSLIPDLFDRWKSGSKVVMCVKEQSRESAAMFVIRSLYYRLIGRLADIELTKNFTGFGLYDREVIECLRRIDDPYPYFRGLVADLGFPSAKVPFVQPTRKRGVTKNNFYTLYDLAMLGITNHSKVPLRLATMAGFAIAMLSFLVACGYMVAKLLFWDRFEFGFAPLIIGLFFFSSVQLFFIGIVGEYVGAIHTQVLKRPLVFERERVNFEMDPARTEFESAT